MLEQFTGDRLYLNGKRLIEGLDWLEHEDDDTILVHEKHGLRAGNSPDVLAREMAGAVGCAFQVAGVEPYREDKPCPWRVVRLRELRLEDEVRAAYTSLPE